MKRWAILLMLLACGCNTRFKSGVPTPKKAGEPAKVETPRVNLSEALEQAKSKDCNVLLHFSAVWCGPCRIMEKETFPDPAVMKELERFIVLHVDLDEEPELAQRYKVAAIPAVVIVQSSGEAVARHVGLMNPKQFVAWLKNPK